MELYIFPTLVYNLLQRVKSCYVETEYKQKDKDILNKVNR